MIYSTVVLHNKNSVSHDVRINIGGMGKDNVACLDASFFGDA